MKNTRLQAFARLCFLLLALVLLLGKGMYIPHGVFTALTLLLAAATAWNAYLDFRRRRPRGRMLLGWVLCVALAVAFALTALGIAGEAEEGWQVAAGTLGGAAFVSLAAGVWCLVRWRRLRLEAEVRLWQVRKERRRRARQNRIAE